ncbi:hypothetical protein ACLQ2R_02785 [Streptosporangium sp. DT93]|uniref:hypothetical protein n=1 Tax=Streptosporangium sp. DT93 TaxID=3393428 RepID=UPI003CF44E9E
MPIPYLAVAAEPDVFARYIGVAAAAIALLSLFISWHTYRRAGARISVTAQEDMRVQSTTASGTEVRHRVIDVTLRNRGMARVQVIGVFLENRPLVLPLDMGDRLPQVLEGFHEATWEVPVRALPKSIRLVDGKARIRLGAKLATGKNHMSPWLTIYDPSH